MFPIAGENVVDCAWYNAVLYNAVLYNAVLYNAK